MHTEDKVPDTAVVQEPAHYSLPEWETPARYPAKRHLSAGRAYDKGRRKIVFILDRHLPSDRKYLGFSRTLFLLFVLILLLVLLALILGLSIGLSLRNRTEHKNLPLGSETYTGDLTYYEPGLGACGRVSGSNDNIVSISHFTFDSLAKGADPNANTLCGHKLRAIRDGKNLDLTVVDRCVGCKPTDIDVSPGAFKKLADPDLGRVSVTWAWLPPIPST